MSAEASAAAEYVGKEHKLVLSQVTHSIGETLRSSAWAQMRSLAAACNPGIVGLDRVASEPYGS